MLYTDLFSFEDFNEMVADGYISVRDHMNLPYSILNYTDKAQYDQVWNDVTVNCRGLIVNMHTKEIIARGFPKFFNYGQPGAAEFSLNTRVEVTDKMDGSLGIMYPTSDGYRIATRGSFHSDQAGIASMILRTRYPDFTLSDTLRDNYTVLFEIIYPENRIVLDYGGMSDLVLLGMVSNETGMTRGPNNVALRHWTGPRAEVFGYMTFAEALVCLRVLMQKALLSVIVCMVGCLRLSRRIIFVCIRWSLV